MAVAWRAPTSPKTQFEPNTCSKFFFSIFLSFFLFFKDVSCSGWRTDWLTNSGLSWDEVPSFVSTFNSSFEIAAAAAAIAATPPTPPSCCCCSRSGLCYTNITTHIFYLLAAPSREKKAKKGRRRRRRQQQPLVPTTTITRQGRRSGPGRAETKKIMDDSEKEKAFLDWDDSLAGFDSVLFVAVGPFVRLSVGFSFPARRLCLWLSLLDGFFFFFFFHISFCRPRNSRWER